MDRLAGRPALADRHPFDILVGIHAELLHHRARADVAGVALVADADDLALELLDLLDGAVRLDDDRPVHLAQPDVGEQHVDVGILGIEIEERRRRHRGGIDVSGDQRLNALRRATEIDDVHRAPFVLVEGRLGILADGQKGDLRVDQAGRIAQPDDAVLSARHMRRRHEPETGRRGQMVESPSRDHRFPPIIGRRPPGRIPSRSSAASARRLARRLRDCRPARHAFPPGRPRAAGSPAACRARP